MSLGLKARDALDILLTGKGMANVFISKLTRNAAALHSVLYQMPGKRWLSGLIIGFIVASSGYSAATDIVPFEKSLKAPDPYTLVSEQSFLDGYAPINTAGLVNVVVEIPTGSTAKWEVTKPLGELKWEKKKGRYRTVNYLGYPGNYGMIPRTLLPKALGGDGDPLDVIILGPAVPRGSVVPVKLIGVLRLVDGGEQDDKLIAVMEGTPFYAVSSIKELDSQFHGVSNIVETWFVNYKGVGKLQSRGFSGRAEADSLLQESIKAF